MLCHTFGISPLTTITKHYSRLINPTITLGTNNYALSRDGNVFEIDIVIPKVHMFDAVEDTLTMYDFRLYVKNIRRVFGIKDRAYEVSQLLPQKIHKGMKNGGYVGYSYGQLNIASFVYEEDIEILKGLSTLMPDKPSKAQAVALSSLYGVLCRSAFITDNDGEVDAVKTYLTGNTPLFSIKDIRKVGSYAFKCLRPAHAQYLNEGFSNAY